MTQEQRKFDVAGMLTLLVLTAALPGQAHAGSACAEQLVLVGPDVKTAIIIGDDWQQRPALDWGAHQVLSRYFEVITGIRVPVLRARDARGSDFDVRIWVNPQPALNAVVGDALERSDEEGFVIRIVGSDVYLASRTREGNYWAAYELLERFAGCRWYGPEPRFWMPQEDGHRGPLDIIPAAQRIRVPADLDLVAEPAYRMRYFRPTPLYSFRLRYRDRFHHNLVSILDPRTVGQTHPEFFPLIDGKRHIPVDAPHTFQPCTSNPELVEFVAAAAIAHFRDNSDASSFSLGMNDTNLYCTCDACARITFAGVTDRNQAIAYRFFLFYNQVAELVAREFPEKRLGCLAYAVLTSLPPDVIKLHPMIVPYLTRDSAQLFDPREQEEFRETIDRWSGLTHRMGIYEYMYGNGFFVPRIYNRYLVRNLRERYGAGIDGFYAEAYPNWGLDGPKYWLVSRLLWDNTLDPEALLSQYYQDLFGPAAAAMRAYFDLLEETWYTQTLDSDRSNYRWYRDVKQLEIFSPQVCQHAWKRLEEAEAAAGDDADVLARIAYFRHSFDVTRQLSRRYHSSRDIQRIGELHEADPLEGMTQLLPALAQWLDGGRLYDAVGTVNHTYDPQVAPLAVHGPALVKAVKQFDPPPLVPVRALAEALVDEAAAVSLAEHPPDEWSQRVRTQIQQRLQAAAEEAGADTTAAAELIRQIAESSVMIVRRVERAPRIDGHIDPGPWGTPVYRGPFHEVYQLDQVTSRQNTVYAVHDGRRLYLAFDFEQEPQTIGADVEGRDVSNWRDPAMRHDDALILGFITPGFPWQAIRINVNGAVNYDGGLEGAERPNDQAAARRTDTGWHLELALDLDRLAAALARDRIVRMPLVRNMRQTRPNARSEPVFDMHLSSITPMPQTGRIIGAGNHATLMTFVTGPRIILE